MIAEHHFQHHFYEYHCSISIIRSLTLSAQWWFAYSPKTRLRTKKKKQPLSIDSFNNLTKKTFFKIETLKSALLGDAAAAASTPPQTVWSALLYWFKCTMWLFDTHVFKSIIQTITFRFRVNHYSVHKVDSIWMIIYFIFEFLFVLFLYFSISIYIKFIGSVLSFQSLTKLYKRGLSEHFK